jgi:hypothetical protein
MKKRSILLLLAIIGALVFTLGSASAGPGDQIDVGYGSFHAGFICYDFDHNHGTVENGTQCGPTNDTVRVGVMNRSLTVLPRDFLK